MLTFDDYDLRKLKEQDLEQVLQWRNLDRIMRLGYTDHVISMEEHRAWFGRVKDGLTALHFIFEHQGQPVGVAYFNQINRTHGTCTWGFYLGEADLPRGSGMILGYLALNHIFGAECLRKVSGEVFDFNEASQRFFQRLGFTEEGRRKRHAFKDEKYIDVIIFALFAEEWANSCRPAVEQILRNNRERQRIEVGTGNQPDIT